MKTKASIMKNYAKLIARMGVNVQKGQDVIIHAGLDQPDFVTMLVDACYKAGANNVSVEWEYLPVTKLTYRKASVKTLSQIPNWKKEKLEHQAVTLPAVIYIESDDPDGMNGVNQKKIAQVRQAHYKVIKPIRDKMENKYQWCIAAVPGKEWAKKLFPNERTSTAEKKLWELILYTSRADNDCPIQNWVNHNNDIQSRYDHLNSLHLAKLKYKASNGTDFTVGLIPEALFLGGSEKTLSGVEFNPNIPTEEVFTSPMKGVAEGKVVATKPLSYQGELIENFWLTFKDGKVVKFGAEKGEKLLETMLKMDETASMLGEVSFVPEESPINKSGVLFYNTLFDENACCHLALGFGFENCIKGFENMSLEECRKLGINDSIIHVDFMIGAPDMQIDGIDANGKVYPIFKNGTWAF